jgi:HAD superfamily hydrolase (TIGR01549 family)
MAVKAVVFDVGGTLLDEHRTWSALCVKYGWSEFEFFAALGAAIERRQHHTDVLRMMGAAEQREEAPFDARDFYPDALPTLREAKARGALVGVAGNTSKRAELFVAAHVDVDFVASSSSWGVEKPSSEFFARVVAACGCDPAAIVYVGDRIDNDIVPAVEAGLQTYFVRRGPWAIIQQSWPEAAAVHAAGETLDGIFSVAW